MTPQLIFAKTGFSSSLIMISFVLADRRPLHHDFNRRLTKIKICWVLTRQWVLFPNDRPKLECVLANPLGVWDSHCGNDPRDFLGEIPHF